MSKPLKIKTPPSNIFPLLPNASIWPRHRASDSRDSRPSSSNGSALPTPKLNIVSATRPSSRPCDARTDAAPNVGPTHGLQIAPRSTPTPNWPHRPLLGASLEDRKEPGNKGKRNADEVHDSAPKSLSSGMLPGSPGAFHQMIATLRSCLDR